MTITSFLLKITFRLVGIILLLTLGGCLMISGVHLCILWNDYLIKTLTNNATNSNDPFAKFGGYEVKNNDYSQYEQYRVK